MINKAEELRPCATIIINLPVIPQDVFDNIPVSINPIWPTEE